MAVSKEDFLKVWKDSSREDILNQYYYDYKFTRELCDKVNKAIEKIESVRIYGLRSGRTLIGTLLNDVLDILKESDDE